MEMQLTLANYDDLFSCFVFSDEASFHLSDNVNRHNVWEEFDYRLDVCHATNGGHTEHLKGHHHHHHHQSLLPKGSSFTANSGTKDAILPKGRSFTANPGIKFVVLLGKNRCDSFRFFPHTTLSLACCCCCWVLRHFFYI